MSCWYKTLYFPFYQGNLKNYTALHYEIKICILIVSKQIKWQYNKWAIFLGSYERKKYESYCEKNGSSA